MKTQYLSIAKEALLILSIVAAVVIPVSSMAATQKTDKPVIHLTTEQYKELQRLQKDLHARSAEGKQCHLEYLDCWDEPDGWDCNYNFITGYETCTQKILHKCGKPTLVCD